MYDMKKLMIEINFDEEIPKSEQWEVASHLSGLITEEFVYYSEHYPYTDVNAYFVKDKDE